MKRGNRLEGTRVSLLLLASSFEEAFDRFEERSGDASFEGQDFQGSEINLHIPFSPFCVHFLSLSLFPSTRVKEITINRPRVCYFVRRARFFNSVNGDTFSPRRKKRCEIYFREMAQ